MGTRIVGIVDGPDVTRDPFQRCALFLAICGDDRRAEKVKTHFS